jgi:hypothetical protein
LKGEGDLEKRDRSKYDADTVYGILKVDRAYLCRAPELTTPHALDRRYFDRDVVMVEEVGRVELRGLFGGVFIHVKEVAHPYMYENGRI